MPATSAAARPRESQARTARSAHGQEALHDGFPSGSAVTDRIHGCRLTTWHGRGPAAPAALDPVRGIMPVAKDHIALRLSIMPDHARDRGAARLDPDASRSQAHQPCADVLRAGLSGPPVPDPECRPSRVVEGHDAGSGLGNTSVPWPGRPLRPVGVGGFSEAELGTLAD